MILFRAKRDGTVETTPSLVPQGSSMQDLVVVSEFGYALCTINLYPASGEYIEPLICQPVRSEAGATILWTANLPPEATVVPGRVSYQLVFSAADGTKQSTLMGSFTVPRGVIANVPDSVDGLGEKSIADLYTMLSSILSVANGLDRELSTSIDVRTATIPVSEWLDDSPTRADFSIEQLGVGNVALLFPADKDTLTAATNARLTIEPYPFYGFNVSNIEVFRASADSAPTNDLNFIAVIIRDTDSAVSPRVALVGIDSYGSDNGDTAGGVDQAAVEAIVKAIVPGWAREKNKPDYSKRDVGLGNVDNVKQYSESNPPPYPVASVNGKTGDVSIAVPSKASDIGADEVGTAGRQVSAHNTSTASHIDLRAEIKALADRLAAVLDSDDTTLDELSEIVAYIKSNKNLIDAITTSKVSVSDIVNNLVTNVTNKPLSAAQGVALKTLIDSLDTDKLSASDLAAAIKTALKEAKNSGEFNGDDGTSAYQYALAGGYIGSEADFKKKMAQEIPYALPNPEPIIINGVRYDGTKEIELHLDELPIVSSVDEMTDPDQLYVLESTGKIWRRRYYKGSTNWLPMAYTSPTDHSPFNGKGYIVGKRIVGGTGEIKDQSNCLITGFIPIRTGYTIRWRYLNMNSSNYGCIAPYYDENGNILPNQHAGYGNAGAGGTVVKLPNGDFELVVPEQSSLESARYIRLQLSNTSSDPSPATGIITVNEEISETETGWYWVDTGIQYTWGNDTALLALEERIAANERRLDEIEGDGQSGAAYADLPEYWHEHIKAKIAEIKVAQALAGQRCVTWGVIADMHETSNRGKSGAIMRHIANECGVNAVLVLGDISRRDTKPDAEAARQTVKNAWNMLAPIRDKVLAVRGNHDGGYGASDATLLNPSEVDDLVTYSMTTGLEIHWDAVGSGYYADDKGAKVRYIMLNTCHRGANPDSTSASYMNVYRYTQVQFDMVKEALTTIPNDSWRVIVASHIPPVASVDRYGDGVWVNNISANFVDMVAMRRLIKAYINRTTVTVSSAGTFGWDKVSMTADFSTAKGRLIEYNAAHLHVFKELTSDYNDTGTGETLGLPVTLFRCDGFNENEANDSTELDNAYADQRVAGTTTEQCLYVNVCNIDTGRITHIQIGVQEPKR